MSVPRANFNCHKNQILAVTDRPLTPGKHAVKNTRYQRQTTIRLLLWAAAIAGINGCGQNYDRLPDEQQQAVASLRSHGSEVMVNGQHAVWWIHPNHLSTEQMRDADMPQVGLFKNLERLSLFETEVTDAGLHELRGLTQLDTLTLSGTNISSAGLLNLASLKKLKRLYLDDTSINDEGLTHLKGLENLAYLDLSGTSVTVKGVETLAAALKRLKDGLNKQRGSDDQLPECNIQR